jgi:hypothetical protein
MKSIQIISGIAMIFFLTKVYVVASQEAKAECFMSSIIFMLILILTSHFIGMARIDKDISDEIKKNHFDKLNKRKRSTNVDNV